MDSSASIENTSPQVVFRPSKKRKQLRQRTEENETPTNDAASQPPAPPQIGDAKTHDDDGEAASEETQGLSVAEALRLRSTRRSRPKGVEFRPESPAKEIAAEQSLVPKDEAEAVEVGVSRRFAPQAGLVGELTNKHMEEYIESELARRHAADKAAQASASLQPGTSSAAMAAGGADPSKTRGDQKMMGGRLQEVDLGDEVRIRNAAMTEQARRRLAGEQLEDESDSSRKRARLGKDGKPWRGRKRRASDDIKRDQMVEALMRESRLDIYEQPVQQETAAEPGTDEAADERIAEEFRREFMDAMAERRSHRRKAPAPPPRPGAKQEEILKGPKLGGSRNARAAMRDLLLSQQEKDKKKR